MIWIKTIEDYISPQMDDVHPLGELVLHDFEQIIPLANLPYTDKNWAILAYSVIKNSLSPNPTDDLARFLHNSKLKSDSTNQIQSLYFDTQVINRFECEWTREIRYYTNDNFLGKGFGVFSVKFHPNVSNVSQIRNIARLIQFKLTEGQCHRFIIAVVQSGQSNQSHQLNWNIVYIESIPSKKLPMSFYTIRNLNVAVVEEPPVEFFYAMKNRESLNNLKHSECSFFVTTGY
jgi:hypothetical protein